MEFDQDLERSLAVLRSGGLILYPTDTIWGIGCDATRSEAVEKVFALKQRPAEKSLIVLLADKRDLLRYTASPDPRILDYLRAVTKPTTVIYEAPIGLAPELVSAEGTIAIRLVDEPFCRHLIKRLRRPLVSTSANISGRPAPAFFQEIEPAIREGVDYIVRYRQDDLSRRQPSAVVRWGRDGTLTVIRP